MNIVLGVLASFILATAAMADTAEQNAAFVRAANLNRTGDHTSAYVALKALDDSGYRNPELDFEIGWSLLGMGRAGACVPRLERYRKAAAGRAIAAELLGRCHLLLRNYDKAEAEFRAAVAIDPESRSRVDLYLSQVHAERGDRQAAQASLAGLAAGDSAVGRALRDSQAVFAAMAPPPGSGLKLTASAAIGFNSNVIGLGNTTPLPADISGRSSSFMRGAFGLSNSAQMDAQTRGTIGYGLLADRYVEIRAANTDDHYLYAEVVRRESERFGYALRASLQVTFLNDTHFRTQPMVRAGLYYRFTPNSTTEAAYALAASDYAPAATPAFDRSGDVHALTISHVVRIPDSSWSGSVGVSHVENRTAGSDFRSRSNAVSGGLRYAFNSRAALSVGGTYGRDRYDNPNSLSAAGLARRDNPHSTFAQLGGPINDTLRYYVQLQATRSASNLTFYDFRQRSLVGGVTVDF